MRLNDSCYQCDEPAVSTEHVPPKAFVPHGKRDGAFEHVRSCFEHNTARAKDDEYTAATMALVTESAYDDPKYIGKIQRALHRGNGALGKKVRGSMTDEGGHILIKHDIDRTGRVFGDIAAALYFVATGSKAKGKRFVSSQGTFTDHPDPKVRAAVQHNGAIEAVRLAFHETEVFPVRGRDQSVLWYQVAPAGAVRFMLNESVDNIVIWPWCDFTALFQEAAAWLSLRGTNRTLERQLRALVDAAHGSTNTEL